MKDCEEDQKLSLSDEEWKSRLPKERYGVLRKKGTEPPFTGELLSNRKEGVYACAGCGKELFHHMTKFDSGSGWPSFFAPLSEGAVEERPDDSHMMQRTEVVCSRCGGHLGHVFEDGPPPTGLRYCINSLSLEFTEFDKRG